MPFYTLPDFLLKTKHLHLESSIFQIYTSNGPTRKKHLSLKPFGTKIPNPGPVSRRAKREMFDVSPRVGAVGGHFEKVSSWSPGGILLARAAL
jgi:hypothetical protein